MKITLFSVHRGHRAAGPSHRSPLAATAKASSCLQKHTTFHIWEKQTLSCLWIALIEEIISFWECLGAFIGLMFECTMCINRWHSDAAKPYWTCVGFHLVQTWKKCVCHLARALQLLKPTWRCCVSLSLHVFHNRLIPTSTIFLVTNLFISLLKPGD